VSVSRNLARAAMTSVGAVLLCTSFSAQAVPAPDPISLVFVVNLKNPVESLSSSDVRLMLLGERSHWPDGARVTVVMRQPKEPERDAVIRLVCRLEERDYTRTVLRAVFTGELRSAPKVLDTPAGVLRFIYNVPGAIGYVRASDVDANVRAVRLSDPPDGVAVGFTLRTR
jgi:ABC-type phosphate transport system substrate-binding protein